MVSILVQERIKNAQHVILDPKLFKEYMMYRIITILVAILLLAGCSAQNSQPSPTITLSSDYISNNIQPEEDDVVKKTEELIEMYPGYVTIDGIVGCAEAWLEKEQGLTPLTDIGEDELPWLSDPIIKQYAYKIRALRLNNGDMFIIIGTNDLGDDIEQFEAFVTKHVESLAENLDAESYITIYSRYTRIAVSKSHMSEILNAILSAEQDCWPD